MDGNEWMDGEGGRLMDGDVDGWRSRRMEIEMEGDGMVVERDRDGLRWRYTDKTFWMETDGWRWIDIYGWMKTDVDGRMEMDGWRWIDRDEN